MFSLSKKWLVGISVGGICQKPRPTMAEIATVTRKSEAKAAVAKKSKWKREQKQAAFALALALGSGQGRQRPSHSQIREESFSGLKEFPNGIIYSGVRVGGRRQRRREETFLEVKGMGQKFP